MKCVCEKETLIRAVSIVGRLATSRATLPILQNIYLEAGNEGLILKATDLDQTLEANIAADVHDKGKVTVPARLLTEYLQNNSDHSLTLFTEDLTLHIDSANHKAAIKGLAAEEYPTVPKSKADKSLTLEAQPLADAISRTIFAAAADDSRPVLTGLLWRFAGKELELVATDGYRLAHHSLDVSPGVEGDFLVPRRSIQELQRVLEGDKVEVVFSANQVRFRTDTVELTSRTLEGKFPDYKAILPKTKELEVKVSGPSLLQSLKLASLFSRDTAYSTKITVEGNKLQIQANSVQLGDNTNEVLIDKAVEKPLTISVNSQYLIEALAHFSREVVLELVDQKSPIVLRPTSKDPYLYLVMPLRSE